MRKAFIFSIAVLAVMMTACEVNSGLEMGCSGINLTVSLSESEVQVKSSNADNGYNENLLNSYYYFFYPKDVTDQAPALKGYVAGISRTDQHSTVVPASSNTINNILFATANKCSLFVVANPPASLEEALKGSPTLAQLRAMMVLSSLRNAPQSNFVMIYDGLIEVKSRSQELAVDATATLSRLACKFTVGAYVTPEITAGSKTYTPVTEEGGLTVTFCHGVNRTTLGGYDSGIVTSADYFNSAVVELSRQTASVPLEEGGEVVDFHYYKSVAPIYTYPMEWEFASEMEPYLLYALKWRISEEGKGDEFKTLYYKLTLGRRELSSNQWYDITAKLTVLGNLYPEDPVVLFPYMNYQVLGWTDAFIPGSDPNTSAVIKDTRYLSVPQSERILNNKDEVSIPFSSSHECEVGNAKMIKVSYSTGTASTTTTNLNPADPSIVRFDLSQQEITVTHKLNNVLGRTMDVTPVTIEFDLRHKDNTSFTEHIKITQYPAIYLQTYANSGGRSSSNDYGYTYVNNAQSGNWQIVLGANASGNNSSIYLTVITVTQFDPSTGFIVGDPRDPNVDNLDKNVSAGIQWNNVNPVNAPAKYHGDGTAGNRQIMYYHPTVDDGSMDNVVAPSFRVNSANCRSGQNETYENARQRCAAYQEDGYPAGRWRLPTLAECKLIQTMSSNGIVPTIFIQNSTSYYCYSGGWFAGNASQDSHYHPYSAGYSKTTSSGGNGGGAARCVYDEWYWSQVDAEFGWDNSNKTTFTWGDVPSNYVHNTVTP